MTTKILIIDDDEKLRDLYSQTLKNQGYLVFTAAEGKEGITTIKNERPDLVLLDIMLPTVHGLDILEMIKSTEEIKDTKIVIFSALSDNSTKEQALQSGAIDYLVKSETTTEDILGTIKKILNLK